MESSLRTDADLGAFFVSILSHLSAGVGVPYSPMGYILAILQALFAALIQAFTKRAPDPVVTDAPPAPRGLREHVRDRLRRHRERARGVDPADDIRG